MIGISFRWWSHWSRDGGGYDSCWLLKGGCGSEEMNGEVRCRQRNCVVVKHVVLGNGGLWRRRGVCVILWRLERRF